VNSKINFFKRLKIAIFNLDEYGIFIEEKLSVSIKYILLLIIFSSIILSIFTTIGVNKEIDKGMNYFQNEFPNFKFEGTNLKLENYVEGYDKEFDVKIIGDTTENLNQKKIDEYVASTKDAKTALIVLSDKIIYRSYDLQNEYTYENMNSAIKLENSSKEDLLNEYNSMGGKSTVVFAGVITTAIVFFLENSLDIFAYVFLVSIVGIIAGRICGIAVKMSIAFTLAIYSLTVSNICSVLYTIIYTYTGFEIKYFNTMYLMIAYVYIIAAILIIKTDLIKKSQDLMRIKSVEEQFQDELKQKELEEKEKQDKKEEPKDEKEDKKDSPKNREKEPNIEPDGSEI